MFYFPVSLSPPAQDTSCAGSPSGNPRWKTVRLFVPKLITPLPILPLPFCFSFLLNCRYILQFRRKKILFYFYILFISVLQYKRKLLLFKINTSFLKTWKPGWIVLADEALHGSTLHDMSEYWNNCCGPIQFLGFSKVNINLSQSSKFKSTKLNCGCCWVKVKWEKLSNSFLTDRLAYLPQNYLSLCPLQIEKEPTNVSLLLLYIFIFR